jgi:hypothetical protein
MARATGNGRMRHASMRATSTLLLAAQLLALGHLLVVRHTICPEHGEAIHSESPSDAQTLGSSHEGAAADSTLGAGAPTAEHAHGHCLALANTRERFVPLPAPDVMPGPLLVAATLPSLAIVDAAPAVAVLLLAPKNSPPSV